MQSTHLMAIGLGIACLTIFALATADGPALYNEHCATCHGQTLRGSAHGTALTGPAFESKWLSGDAISALKRDALVAYNMTNMPPGGAAALDAKQHNKIAEHILGTNGIVVSESEVAMSASAENAEASEDNQALDSWSGVDSIAAIAKNRSAFENKTIKRWAPVTQELLNNPPPADWLSWRRTLDGHGFSPLQQINTSNVNSLQLAWVVAMSDGSNQGTPLVHDGVMFLTHPGNRIQALNAATGDLIWDYSYPHPTESETLGAPQRNIALFDDKIFLATTDAALVAIDARDGKPLWRTVKADYRQGYTHTSGPIIADGVVVSGINGCERYKVEGCFITGHDPQTGAELWRTSTIALPGTSGDESWADLAPEFRAGGDTWIAGSYDPELDLFYIGTAQAKPWVAASRGMTTADRALYTNSTLALRPQTGEIVWHYQHIPGETIDMEVGFERVLVNERGQRWLFTVGKDGILWKLDRTNGDFLDYAETISQNLFSNIDKTTGAVTYREDIRNAKLGDPIDTCPGIYGGHNWQAMAFHPPRARLIIPLHQLCSELVGRDVPKVTGEGGFGGDSRSYEMPDVNGLLGKLVAYDTNTLRQRWAHEQRAMFMTGALTTAGDLVFIGDLDRYLHAFDVRNGKSLWKARLGAPTHGYPISYGVGGDQYIAVLTGMGVFRAMTAVVSPDIYQPANGQALYVFKLPN